MDPDLIILRKYTSGEDGKNNLNSVRTTSGMQLDLDPVCIEGYSFGRAEKQRA